VLTSLVGNTQFAPIPSPDPHTGREYFINVRLEDEFRSHVSDLGDIFLRTALGRRGAALDGGRDPALGGPVAITRRYMQRMISITGRLRAHGPILGAASAAARRVLAELTPPTGFSVRLGGQTEAQEKTFADLRTAALMRAGARLHGARLAVQVARRSAGDHVQRAAGDHRRLHHSSTSRAPRSTSTATWASS
jgi:hypothetical protein